MALTSEQIAWTARIARELKEVITAALAARPLDTNQELILGDDIDLWQSIENSFVKFKGDGVDFDNERKREGIFYRVREMLGLPFMVYDRNAYLYTMELIELEVGQNF